MLEQMREMWYNTGVNPIKSSGALERTRYPFSTRVRGTDTMPDHTTPQLSALKVCKTCGKSKPLIEYDKYVSGSYKPNCKACTNARRRQRRLADPERARAIKNKAYAKNRERYQAEIRARISADTEYRKKRNEWKRKWRQENRDHVAKLKKEHYAGAGGEVVRQYAREVRHREPEKYKARYLVTSAVQCGRFPPASGMVCEHCQEAQAAEWHHHKGYSEEFAMDVIALCKECHGKDRRVVP